MQIQAKVNADAVNQFFTDLHNQIPFAQLQASQAATDVLYQQLSLQLNSQDNIPLVVIGRRLKKNTSLEVGKVWLGINPVSSAYLNPRESGTGAYLGNQFIDGAFVINRHGKANLFKREGSKRYPINPVNAYIASPNTDNQQATDKYTDVFMTEIDKTNG